MATKTKSKPALYIGRSRQWGYEIGSDRNRWTKTKGFPVLVDTGHICIVIHYKDAKHYFGKLKLGEVRRLHVRIGK